MDSREKELAFLEAELVECQGRLKQELLGVGAAVAAGAPASVADAELTRLLDDARALQVRVDQARDLIAQVQTRAERAASIDAIVRGNDQRVRDAMREVEHRYREIGEVAAKVYRDQCADKPRFQEVFQPLLTLNEDLDRMRQEVAKLEEEGQKHGFFAKVMDKSKILLVEAKMRYREIDRPTTLEEIGRRVCASKFPESVNDQAFAELMAKIETNRKRAIEIQEETAQLRVEQARLEEELRALGVGADAAARVKELEGEIQNADKQLRETHRALGTQVCERNLVAQVSAVDLTLRLRTVNELREVEKAKLARMDRLRSAMDLDRVGDDLSKLHAQKTQLELQIKEAQAKLATVDAELGRQNERSEDLRRRSGDEVGKGGAGGAAGAGSAGASGGTAGAAGGTGAAGAAAPGAPVAQGEPAAAGSMPGSEARPG